MGGCGANALHCVHEFMMDGMLILFGSVRFLGQGTKDRHPNI